MQKNEQLMRILNIFSFMAIIISSFGILSNIGISFIQRRRSLAVVNSLGMTRTQSLNMLLVESIVSIFWATFIVTLYGGLGLSLISKIVNLIGVPLNIGFNIKFIPIIFIASLCIVLLATVPVLIKNKNISIVQELKYE